MPEGFKTYIQTYLNLNMDDERKKNRSLIFYRYRKLNRVFYFFVEKNYIFFCKKSRAFLKRDLYLHENKKCKIEFECLKCEYIENTYKKY